MLSHKSTFSRQDQACSEEKDSKTQVWRAKERRMYTAGVIAFPTCLGQDFHEGAKLEAQTAFMGQVADEVIIIETEVLYRHTLQITEGLSKTEASKEALRRTALWEKQEEATLRAIRTKKTIFRWSELLVHPKYLETLKRIESMRFDDRAYNETICAEAHNFVEKLKSKGALAVSDDEAFKLCVKYLEEESAVMAVLFLHVREYDSILYPYSMSPSVDATLKKYDINVQWLQPDLLKATDQIQRRSNSLDSDSLLQGLEELDDAVDRIMEVGEVKKSSLLFLLKGAEASVREKLSVVIEASVRATRPDLILYKLVSTTFTRLAFSLAKYEEEFEHDWKKYMPSNYLDSKQTTVWEHGGVINLHREQQEKVIELGVRLMQDFVDQDSLFNILTFFYSSLVFKDVAPEAKIYRDDESGSFRFTCVDETEDQDDALRKTLQFLRMLVHPNEHIVENVISMQENVGIKFVQVLDPKLLALLIFDKYHESVYSPRLSSSTTPSASSTPLLFSPRSSPSLSSSSSTLSSPNPSPTPTNLVENRGFTPLRGDVKKHISPHKHKTPRSRRNSGMSVGDSGLSVNVTTVTSQNIGSYIYGFVPVEKPPVYEPLGTLDMSSIHRMESDDSIGVSRSLVIHPRGKQPMLQASSSGTSSDSATGSFKGPFRQLDFNSEVDLAPSTLLASTGDEEIAEHRPRRTTTPEFKHD